MNTESCEQGFRRLNQYFDLTRKMTQFKRNVLFWFVNECFNTDLEEELRVLLNGQSDNKKVIVNRYVIAFCKPLER